MDTTQPKNSKGDILIADEYRSALMEETKRREQSEQDLRERLRFEHLLSELSARFVNIPPDRVDSEIESGLRQILEFFQVDRAGLVQTLPGRSFHKITHVAYSENVPPVPAGIELPVSITPWAYEKVILKRETVAFSSLEDLPPEARVDKETWAGWGIRSNVDIPISIGEHIDHVIAINSVKSERVWDEKLFPRLQLVGEIFVNALERKRDRLEIEELLRFERLISDLSAGFVNLPPDEVNSQIEDAQRRVCECLGLDLSALWQWSAESPRYFMMTHLHGPLKDAQLPERIDAQEMFPWQWQKMLLGETLAFSTEDLPEEASHDKESRRQFGIKSSVVIPLSAGGGLLVGALTFDTMQTERTWPEALVKRLKLIAQLFANALARKRSEEILRESEERLDLAADSAGAGLWSLDLATGCYWLTKKTRELFGFSPDEMVTFDRFLGLVHPDDRELIRKTVQTVVESKKEGKVEYRVIQADGKVRWMSSMGRAHYNVSGKPDSLMGVSVDITDRKHMEERLRENLIEIENLKERLENENVYLQEEIKLLGEHTEIVGQSPAMKKILAQAEQVAPIDSTVLILGETGTGKLLLARAIHNMSARKDRPMITVNCASLPPTLIESELFGRERGAYTGALTRMVGRFEVADGSTLFLDEIGELPFELQSKLLRVLEEGNFERLGSTKTLHVNVRIIAATNRDLAEDVKEEKFRKDLYYRLNVFPISIPPLRERPEDIPLLVWTFIKEFKKKVGKRIDSIPRKSMKALQRYSWPGNVRELRNVIEHDMIVSSGGTLAVGLTLLEAYETHENSDLKNIEREHLLSVLKKTNWRVGGKGGAAEILGLKRTTLNSLMKRLGITRHTG